MTTKHNEESIQLKATKGGLSFLRWLIPLLLSGGLITGGGKVLASDMDVLNARVDKIEQAVTDNTLEINGQNVKLSEYDARFVELQKDVRETRNDTKQILIILTKRH